MKKWVAGGVLMGALIGSSPMWSELFSRLGAHTGEKADWGEPLFFAGLMGLPGALVGGLLGALLGLAFRHRQGPPPT